MSDRIVPVFLLRLIGVLIFGSGLFIAIESWRLGVADWEIIGKAVAIVVSRPPRRKHCMSTLQGLLRTTSASNNLVSSRTSYGLLLMGGLLSVGCDPVRTTLQPVRMQVLDSASGQPVVGAQVLLAFDAAAAPPWKEEPEEWRKKRIEEYKRAGFRGITSKEGQADIDAEFTALDRTSGSKPPSKRDFVTGQPYLIKVKAGEVSEQMSLVMKRGASVKGTSYTVTVLDIDEPRYVQTKND
jgi:hypothetical protein